MGGRRERRGTVPKFLQTWPKKLQSSSLVTIVAWSRPIFAGDVPRMFSLIKNSFCVCKERDEERDEDENRERFEKRER